jgi:release factor glutamine methyltransferase
MDKMELFNSLLSELKQSLVLSPDQPDETPETTLLALWHAAANNSCSAKRAKSLELSDLSEDQANRLRHCIAQRLSGMPLMQITGHTHFMGLELEFGPNVFVVRPETEILGNSTVALLRNKTNPILMDIGCGSGNLTCGIACAIPDSKVYAVDILESCVNLTKKNAARCKISDRVSVLQGDLFGPLGSLGLHDSIDAVICNPP